jgi:type IV secretion system protein VirB6
MAGSELVFFKLIVSFINGQLAAFFGTIYGNLLTLCAGLAAIFLLYWVFMRGFEILSGKSRDSVIELMFQAAKMALIVGILSEGAFAGSALRDLIFGLRDEIGLQIYNNATPYAAIDTNLSLMNLGLNAMEALETGGDEVLEGAKSRATTLALVGVATPAITGGLLSLINEISISLAAAFAPLFIVALMFKQTEAMFYAWVKYIVTAVITMGILAVVVQIAMGLSGIFAGALLLAGSVPALQASMMQAGMGIVITVLLVTVPGMIGQLFGTALSHLEYNRFSGMNQNKSQERSAGTGKA